MNRAGKLVLSYNLSTRKGWEFWAGVHREVIKKYGLPDGVKPFRLDYKERNNRGYLMYVGRLEDMDASGRKR
jgi:hypothetical protein